MSLQRAPFPYEAHEAYDPFTQSQPQRQHQQQQPPRSRANTRPSSSSGSAPSLRRTPNFENQRRRAASAGERRPPVNLGSDILDEVESSTTVTAAPQQEESYWPRRTTRISRRTATAILYALEEAIRTPFPFTPDRVEENASMSDLANAGPARVQNGGRPGPRQNPGQPNPNTRITTPTDIMRRRRERAEQRAEQRDQDEENRRIEEERRRSAERRAAAVAGVAGSTANRGIGGRRPTEPLAPIDGNERRRSDRVSGENQFTSSAAQATYPAVSRPQEVRARPDGARTRPASASQAQARPSQPQASRAASATHTQTGNPTERAQAGSAAQSTQRLPRTRSTGQRNGNASSFPHAFERWETLSSHWEGLTQFWIRRLEGNSEELSGQPINQQLARQVTDLSAAGANLFHAVVELQRLRASSERKFQRWFFETRSEQEKTQERIAQLEAELGAEKQARADEGNAGARVEARVEARAEAERISAEEVNRIKRNADQMIKEMKRELQISRDEARRGWEEIGRMEQAERDRTFSLKRGEPTLVGGVQVVPMPQAGTSRQTSTSRGHTGGLSSHPVQHSDYEEPGYTAYDPARSETDTDPFTEGGRDPGYPQTSTSSLVQTTAPTTSLAPASQTTRTAYSQPEANRSAQFYQQQAGTQLHRDEPATSEADARSYVQSADDTISEDDYDLDERGNVRLDEQGNPIMARRGPASEDSDEYNVMEQIERERMYGQRYGGEYGGSTSTGGSRMTGATSNGGGYGSQPDYTGAGFGSGSGWESVVPRHHHPTRLSDVLEEDERSRTSPSRASERSRGVR